MASGNFLNLISAGQPSFALVSWLAGTVYVGREGGRTGQLFALVSWDPVCGQGGRKDWSAFCLG